MLEHSKDWSSTGQPLEEGDPFASLVRTLRIALFLGGLLLAMQRGDRQAFLPTVALLLIVWFRFAWPIRLRSGSSGAYGQLLIDQIIVTTAVIADGSWESPYMPLLTVGIIQLGFVRGYPWGLALAGALTTVLTLADFTISSQPATSETIAQLALVLILSAITAGYVRKIFLESETLHGATVLRLSELTKMNQLLTALHHTAQSLPGALDLDDALVATREQLRRMVDFTTFAIYVHDPISGTWNAKAHEGTPTVGPLRPEAMPTVLRDAIAHDAITNMPTTLHARPLNEELPGLSLRSTTGVYICLKARNATIALLALEHTDPKQLGVHALDLISQSSAVMALAIDNSNRLAQISTLAAERERTRIARDLHDRVAQALAYVAFELERLAKRESADSELTRLHADVKTVMADLRETLTRLRSKVSESADLPTLARLQVMRLRERSGIDAVFTSDVDGHQLPHAVEHEFWRVLQEGLTNIERHARPTRAQISWHVEGGRAELKIVDDGCGFDPNLLERGGERSDQFGILGMRERAHAIGADLQLSSAPGEGTRITVVLDQQSSL